MIVILIVDCVFGFDFEFILIHAFNILIINYIGPKFDFLASSIFSGTGNYKATTTTAQS